MKRAAPLFAVLTLAACAQAPTPSDDLALHRRLLTLDTHLDTPMHFERPGWDFGTRHDMSTDFSQVDIPRMKDGALDGGFFAIYTAQGPLTPEGYAEALAFARRRSDLIDQVMAQHAREIVQVTTADEAERAAAAGRLFAFKSMENSYPLGEDLGLLEEFYRRGVRLASPVHSRNNQFADSSGDKPLWNGLSPLGREWVREMNRLGIVIDASHASDAAFDQMLELSAVPIILSHSSADAAYVHDRNLDDERIRRLARAGGAICVSTIFLSEINLSEERGRLFEDYERARELSPEEDRALAAAWRALDEREPIWAADFEAYMNMLLHVIDVAGVDHVCMGADWDGGGGIRGLEDISALPLVTARLRQAGYSEKDLEKIWSGNVLRILRAAGRHAARGK